MRRRYRLPLALCGCVVSLAVVRFYFWSTRPSNAVITPVPANVEGASTEDLATKELDTNYFVSQLPIRFSQRSMVSGNGNPIYLQQLYTASGGGQSLLVDQFAVTVGKLPSDGINGVGDYKLRTASSDYSAQYFEWLPTQDAYAFEKTSQGYELDMFLVHEGKYVVLVQSGLVQKKAAIVREMSIVLRSFKWN